MKKLLKIFNSKYKIKKSGIAGFFLLLDKPSAISGCGTWKVIPNINGRSDGAALHDIPSRY